MACEIVTIRFNNSCDLGSIEFDTDYFEFSILAEVDQLNPKFSEEGAEDIEAVFKPFRRVLHIKHLLTTAYVPMYLVEAIRLLQYCEEVEADAYGETFSMSEIKVEVDWEQPEGNFALVSLEFSKGERVFKDSCCGVAPTPPPLPTLDTVEGTYDGDLNNTGGENILNVETADILEYGIESGSSMENLNDHPSSDPIIAGAWDQTIALIPIPLTGLVYYRAYLDTARGRFTGGFFTFDTPGLEGRVTANFQLDEVLAAVTNIRFEAEFRAYRLGDEVIKEVDCTEGLTAGVPTVRGISTGKVLDDTETYAMTFKFWLYSSPNDCTSERNNARDKIKVLKNDVVIVDDLAFNSAGYLTIENIVIDAAVDVHYEIIGYYDE